MDIKFPKGSLLYATFNLCNVAENQRAKIELVIGATTVGTRGGWYPIF